MAKRSATSMKWRVKKSGDLQQQQEKGAEQLKGAANEVKEAEHKFEEAKKKLEEAKEELKVAQGELKKRQEKLEQARKSGNAEVIQDAVLARDYAQKAVDAVRSVFGNAQKDRERAEKLYDRLLAQADHLDAEVKFGTPYIASLDAARDIGLRTLKQTFDLWITFNPGMGKTDKLTSGHRNSMQERLGTSCVVCGGHEASLAHVLKSKKTCEKTGLPWDDSNFILLCGSLGEENTCHDSFDTFKMSFWHVSGKDNTHWKVVGSRFHGREVIISSKPHRRAMHAHLTYAMNIEALQVPKRYSPPDDSRISNSPPSRSNASGSPSVDSQSLVSSPSADLSD